jgi:hypothetical protein
VARPQQFTNASSLQEQNVEAKPTFRWNKSLPHDDVQTNSFDYNDSLLTTIERKIDHSTKSKDPVPYQAAS